MSDNEALIELDVLAEFRELREFVLHEAPHKPTLKRLDAVIAHLALSAQEAATEVEWGTEVYDPDGTVIDRDVYDSEQEARHVAATYEETLVRRTVTPWQAVGAE